MIEIIKKYLPYLLVATITLIIYSVVYPNIDFLKNSEIREKINQIELLEKEKEDLLKSAKQHILNSEGFEKKFEKYITENDSLSSKLKTSNIYIMLMKYKLDSLNIDINITDSIIEKITKEEYEILNNSVNNNINEHKQFFTKFIKSKDSN